MRFTNDPPVVGTNDDGATKRRITMTAKQLNSCKQDFKRIFMRLGNEITAEQRTEIETQLRNIQLWLNRVSPRPATKQ
jgi:hypothetical protein